MTKRGRGARIKGANFEREMAKKLSEALGVEFKRGVGQTRGGGAEISDVVSEDLKWIHFELKNQQRCNIKAALRQAIEDVSKSEKIPVAITKDDRSDILVTLLLDDFLGILRAAIDGQKFK